MNTSDRRNLSITFVVLGVLALLGSVIGWGSNELAPNAEAEGLVTTTALSAAAVGTFTDLPASPASSTSSTTSASSTMLPFSTMLPMEDLAGEEPPVGHCLIAAESLRLGAAGDDVRCLQAALLALGSWAGSVTAVFDDATARAVEAFQTQRSLFVDGVVGRETALALEIWPDEASLVVRTPPARSGSVDSLGYPLSSVATTGTEAPPVPADSGSGRRLVYLRQGQRIWAVAEDESIIRSWLISGSKYGNETPGTHEVYSRSEMSTAWNGKAWLPKMVRWLKTDIGAIGFHALPRHVEDNSVYQTESELGTRLSGGCQRQADLDAAFTWDFAQIGTKVVVL